MKYAGFFKRTVAAIVDCLIIFLCAVISYKVIIMIFHPAVIATRDYLFRPWQYVFYPLFTLFILLYFFVFETLGQATLGKHLFALKVVDNQGNQLTLINKLLRFLFVIVFAVSTQLPNILCFEYMFPINEHNKYYFSSYNYIFGILVLLCIISYLCLIFSSKNQTLYDKITKTFVIENKKRPTIIVWMIFLTLLLPMLILFLNNYSILLGGSDFFLIFD